MRVIPLLFGLALIGPRPAGAQGSADPALITEAVREAVTTIRSATERKDWSALEPFFPANTQWSRQIADLVTRAPVGSFVSFWKAEARAELAKLVVQVVASDIAAVQLPFTVGGVSGIWGAVLIRSGDQWRLHCATEAYGYAGRAPPGCVFPAT